MLGRGRSSMRVMPSVASGRYSPGPGTETLLEEGIYQEIRPAVANCSPGGQVSSLQSLLSGQFLDRRIDEVAFLRSEVGSWEDHRNRTEAKVRWRFTTEDARIKLEKLYPVFEYPDRH